MVPADVLANSSLSPGARTAFSILCSHADRKTQECFRGLESLSEDLGCSSRTTQNYLKELETAGLIVKIGKEGRTGRFKVVRDPAKRGPAQVQNARILGVRKARFGQSDGSRSRKEVSADHEPLQPNSPAPAAYDSPPLHSVAPITIPRKQDQEEQRVGAPFSKSRAGGSVLDAQQEGGDRGTEEMGRERDSEPHPIAKGLSQMGQHPRQPDWASIVEKMGLGKEIWIRLIEQIEKVEASICGTSTQAQWIVARALMRSCKERLDPQQALQEEIEAYKRRKG